MDPIAQQIYEIIDFLDLRNKQLPPIVMSRKTGPREETRSVKIKRNFTIPNGDNAEF